MTEWRRSGDGDGVETRRQGYEETSQDSVGAAAWVSLSVVTCRVVIGRGQRAVPIVNVFVLCAGEAAVQAVG